MKKLNKYFERIQFAIKDIESNHKVIIEAKKNMKFKKSLEDKIVKLKKDRISSVELVEQALEEIKLLRKNVIKEKDANG